MFSAFLPDYLKPSIFWFPDQQIVFLAVSDANGLEAGDKSPSMASKLNSMLYKSI